MSAVKLSKISKEYADGVKVIHGIDLTIHDGEFMVFVGPSGCGKSTLLRMIAGLEQITSGELHIGEALANDITPAKRGLAMVFQSYALYPHMSVYENMAFSLKMAKLNKAQVDEAVQQAASILQISHLLQRKPKDLSGGQRQRVAIGRAIVRQPKLFLFDEPLSNLDASLRVQMRIELSRLHQELKTTMIYVTHDQVEAMTLGQRIAVFNAGRIEQVGAPLELYDNPGNLFVAGFLGAPKMNLLKAQVIALAQNSVTVQIADGSTLALTVSAQGLSLGDQVTLGCRAEHVLMLGEDTAADNVLNVSVNFVEHLGDASIVYANLPNATDVIALKLATDTATIKPGCAIKLQFPASRCHLFDASGKACTRIRLS
ncbi:MAG: sn-glycerol-3-phosphate ABC transporter ATP-binding protein UgpC [Undibacterium sp.]|nr:sn-glycerol-3-phosphate ABC transporter ATP-binding protein UgpC [Undibacterium sp.]